MKLATWVKTNGSSFQTAWGMWRDGNLSVSAAQLPTRTLVPAPHKVSTTEPAAFRAQISSADLQADLGANWAPYSGTSVVRPMSPIGSDQNGYRIKIVRRPSDRPAMEKCMKIAELAAQLRQRQADRGMAWSTLCRLSDADIIDCYITCPNCGERQFDRATLARIISQATDAETFVALCNANARSKH